MIQVLLYILAVYLLVAAFEVTVIGAGMAISWHDADPDEPRPSPWSFFLAALVTGALWPVLWTIEFLDALGMWTPPRRK